jgi:hypothetical protein
VNTKNYTLNIDNEDFQYTVEQYLLTRDKESIGTMPESHNLIPDGHILQMILDDIKYVKHTVEGNSAEGRAEFRRIVDKIEALDVSLTKKIADHATDITTLKVKMRLGAWVSGGIAGIGSSTAVLAIAKFILGV